jgi:tripartite-type tricarboxylate transporter receptor subunit TctC
MYSSRASCRVTFNRRREAMIVANPMVVAAQGAILGLACVMAASPATAEPIEEFYKGKTLQMIIRSQAGGGGYDSYARLLARHIGRHIPGNPRITPVNMPGGGGIVAANFIAKVAPKDGTVLTIVSQGLAVDQALGLNASFQADLREFNWVGNMSDSNQILAVWHSSPTKTFDDARKRVTTIGTTQAGSISQQLTAFYNNVLGAKLKIVFGYPDGHDVDLAMQRGEVEGRGTNTWASYVSISPHFVNEKLITPLLQVGLQKDPALPHVPLLREMGLRPQDQPVLDFMSKAVAVGRPIATTPGTPPERVEALRRAFDATLKDPLFIKEAEKERAEISPMTGAQLAGIIRELIEAPDDLKARVREGIQPKKQDIQEVAGGAKKGGE